MMANKMMPVADIADIFDRTVATINSWLADWQKRRLSSIFTGHAGNDNSSKLSDAQKEQLKEVLSCPPSAYGLPKQFWDVPQLRDYIEATFGVVYESERSYHVLLRFCGLSFKYPDTFNKNRDEQKINERVSAIRKEIQPLLENDQWEVFCADEVRIEQEAEVRRAWLRRGERTIVEVDKKRQAQSYMGLLNLCTHTCSIYEMPWQNQEEVLGVLERFLDDHPEKRIAIIWDNAAFHKGQKIRDALGSGNLLEQVHLIALPPYAPDHNPIERVWNAAKGQIANIQRESFVATKDAFTNYIKSRQFVYQF